MKKTSSNYLIIRRLNKVIRVFRRLNTNNLKIILKLIEDFFEDEFIKMHQTTLNGKKLFGIERDITYEAMVTDSFREPHFKELVEILLGTQDNCLDLGANFGTHTMLMSSICNKGRVYSFEPQSLVFQCLSLNIYLNKISNVSLFNFAVTSHSGDLMNIEQIRGSVEQVNSGFSRLVDTSSLHKATTLALDDLTLPKIDFIKMDIQGSELSAIRGMQKLLSRDRPIMFFEIENVHLVFRGTTALELLDEIECNDFIVYRIENDYPSDHLAVPAEKISDFEAIIAESAVSKIIVKVNRTKDLYQD
jgi:FkbM family methyltransferase